MYYVPLGYGSSTNTLKDTRKIDSTIAMQDVMNSKAKNLDKTKNYRGYNSFIPTEPYDQYQVDSFL